MGKIEEVNDDNDEIEVTKRPNGRAKKEHQEEDEEGESDEGANKDDNQATDEDCSDAEEIDFTKVISKEELLDGISSPIELKRHSSDCCGDSDLPEESTDYFEDESSASKSENLSSKRIVAFMVIFPMLASGIFMLNEVFGNFKLGKSSMQATAAIGGALIALFVMSNVKALQSAVKFILCFAWLLFLYPTYQVYHCSPVPLKNDMLGTWFSLKTEASKFSELSYVTSECFRSYQFHSPYMLSAMSVKISLVVDIKDLINLDVAEEKDNNDEEKEKSNVESEFSYFLLLSKRSVKKKFHKLYMMMESDSKLTKTLRTALKLSNSEKEKKLLQITGAVFDVGEPLLPLKKELEGYGYLMRPIKFKAYEVKYIDRYAKLKNYSGVYN